MVPSLRLGKFSNSYIGTIIRTWEKLELQMRLGKSSRLLPRESELRKTCIYLNSDAMDVSSSEILWSIVYSNPKTLSSLSPYIRRNLLKSKIRRLNDTHVIASCICIRKIQDEGVGAGANNHEILLCLFISLPQFFSIQRSVSASNEQ